MSFLSDVLLEQRVDELVQRNTLGLGALGEILEYLGIEMHRGAGGTCGVNFCRYPAKLASVAGLLFFILLHHHHDTSLLLFILAD